MGRLRRANLATLGCVEQLCQAQWLRQVNDFVTPDKARPLKIVDYPALLFVGS
jgi:hypothetical protein